MVVIVCYCDVVSFVYGNFLWVSYIFKYYYINGDFFVRKDLNLVIFGVSNVNVIIVVNSNIMRMIKFVNFIFKFFEVLCEFF